MALAGFDDAPVYNRLPSFEIGTYVAEVIRIEKFEATETKAETDPRLKNFYFKTEFRILEAVPGSGLKVGDEVAECLPLFGQWKTTFFGKVKAMLGAISDEAPRSIKETDIDEAATDDQPYSGEKVRVFVSKATKKKNAEEYARPSYSPYRVAEAAPA